MIYGTKFDLLFENLDFPLKFLWKNLWCHFSFIFNITINGLSKYIPWFTITQTSFVKWEYKVKTGNRLMTYTLNIIRVQLLYDMKCLLASILARDHLDPESRWRKGFFSKQKMTRSFYVGVRKKNQINNCMICYSSEANIKKVAVAEAIW